MTNPTVPDEAPESFGDLPLQPTGSGVADLEIAYEQMKVAEGSDTAAVGGEDVADATFARDGELESEGHPS